VSIPVSYTVIGCLKDGKFWSQQYSYQVETYIDGKQQTLSLDAYEGKTIRIDGALSPGDCLGANTITIIDHKCRPDLHASKFKDPPQNTFDPRMDIDLKSEA
jgi:hypothetical protein